MCVGSGFRGLGFRVLAFRVGPALPLRVYVPNSYSYHNLDLSTTYIKGQSTQTPERIQKVDPLMGVPIKYP